MSVRLRFKSARLARHLARVGADRQGSVFTYTAAALVALLGVVGISVDIGTWYLVKREAQAAADAGALAGALEIQRSDTASAIVSAAELDANRNGYTVAAGDLLQVMHPPQNGSYAGAGDAVEVVLRRPSPSFFSALFRDSENTIAARAVALVELNDTCVWALHPDAKAALKVSGGANSAFSCGVIVNSTSSEALTQSGTGSCLSATQIKVAGQAVGSCINPAPIENAKPVIDPLASLQAPSFGGCDHTGKIKVNGGESRTLTPGVYCGAIEVLSSGVLTFSPGFYVIKGGVNFSAQSTVNGDGVSFYIPDTSSSSANISIAAGASVHFVASASGPLPGILFYHDRNGPTNVSHSLSGGGTMYMEGIVYFPKQHLSFSGGTSTDNNTTILVANTIDFSGSSWLGKVDGSVVEATNLFVAARLVE